MEKISSFIRPEEIGKDTNVPSKSLPASERADLVKQIYELYTHPFERLIRKKENWKRYVGFLKSSRLRDSDDARKTYKAKSANFIRELDVKTFAIRISHIPTQDLYYVLSMCKDHKNSGKSVGAWIFSNIKVGVDSKFAG